MKRLFFCMAILCSNLLVQAQTQITTNSSCDSNSDGKVDITDVTNTTSKVLSKTATETNVVTAEQMNTVLTEINTKLEKLERIETWAKSISDKIGAKTPEEYADSIYKAYKGHEYVEIGGIKWATMNLGATTIADSPETSFGDYYAWGETETYYNTVPREALIVITDWKTTEIGNGYKSVKNGYDWSNYCGNSSFVEWNNIPYDTTTKTLTSDFDAAHVSWGGNWRIPTRTEFENLYKACGGTQKATKVTSSTLPTEQGVYWIPRNTVPGYTVSGYLFVQDSTHSVFFPAAAGTQGQQTMNTNSYGYYWSSSLTVYKDSYSYYMLLEPSMIIPNNGAERWKGMSVRPVAE